MSAHPLRWLFVVTLILAGAGSLALPGCSNSDARTTPAAKAVSSVDDFDEAQVKKRVDRALDLTERRFLRAGPGPDDHAAWQVLHAVLAYGRRAKIYHDGELVGALNYLLKGGQLTGWNLRPAEKGLTALLESGSKTGQGHKDQWLGYLALCDLDLHDKLTVGGKEYEIRDLVEQTKWECTDGMEASWTLLGLHVFEPLDSKWQAADGTTWSLERLLAMEAAQDLNQSACGGSHRLIGMTMAVNKYLSLHPEKNGKLEGPWKAAEEKIQWAIGKAREYQQPDGSFSTNYFVRPGTSPDVAQRIGTTGHTLEFLMLALDDEQLREPWVTRAALHLCNLLEETSEIPVECGALYHAAHAVQLYRMRRWGLRETEAVSQETPVKAEQQGTGE